MKRTPVEISSSKVAPLIIFFIALAFLALLQGIDKVIAPPDGVYSYLNSSDSIPHTLPIVQLRKTPLQSLWYLHKMPPLFDGFRAVIAQFFRRASDENLRLFVDRVLFSLWGGFFAAIATFIYMWVRRLCSSAFAFIASLIWIAHPAPIFFARFLDTTLMSSFGILWFFYELWRLNQSDGSIVRVALASVFLFYIRTVFQWYFFPLVLLSLKLMNASSRSLVKYIGIVCIFVIPHLAKQYIVFNTLSSSSFVGYHKCGVIWYYPSSEETRQIRSTLRFQYPRKADVYSGGDEENSRQQLEDSLIYTKAFNRQLIMNPSRSLRAILKSLKMNAIDYWRPTAQYGRGAIVRYLFWTKFYNAIFSGFLYRGLIVFASCVWIYRYKKQKRFRDARYVCALLIPFFYIFLITHLCNRYEWTEAVRFKFLLEPIFYIFISSTFYRLLLKISLARNRVLKTS